MNPWAGCPQVNSLDPSPGGAFSKADSGTDLSCVPAWGEGGCWLLLITGESSNPGRGGFKALTFWQTVARTNLVSEDPLPGPHAHHPDHPASPFLLEG